MMASNKLQKAFSKERSAETVSEQNSGLSQLKSQPSKFDRARSLIDGAKKNENHPALTQIDQSMLEGYSQDFREWCVLSNYTPNSVIDVPISKLKSSPFNARHFYIPSQLQHLVANIAEHGQQQPIHISPDYSEPGTFFVNEGGRRWRALDALKRLSARAIVLDLTPGAKSYKLSYDLNVTKKDQTPFDDAVKWTALLREGVFKNAKALADALEIGEGQVSKTLSLATIPEHLLELMVSISPEQMGLRKAYEVKRYWEESGNNETTTRTLIENIGAGDYSIKQVQAAIAALKSGQASKTASSRPVFNRRIDFKLANGKGLGSLKTYAEDRLDLKVTGLPVDVRDRLRDIIQDTLKPYEVTKGTQIE
ncbi:ParB/RepB/Spo0J family partition protein [Robbsia andropogonis]|uniref:ParB/RepB/Spo0J family partition protein n=1 Tax=Robbsia andropogonis TaxID=28092 RepID=UPI002A6AEF20|nr:ParB/RepB/Spo0J family partition protein [Robbsia andropogonis]